MFEKQLSHCRARERKQHRPPESNPLCGHLISSTNIKDLALTSNCIASCDLSVCFLFPLSPYFSLLTCPHLIVLSRGIAVFLLLPPKVAVSLIDAYIYIYIYTQIYIYTAARVEASTQFPLAWWLWWDEEVQGGYRGCRGGQGKGRGMPLEPSCVLASLT